MKVYWHWQYLDLCGIQTPDGAQQRLCVFDRFCINLEIWGKVVRFDLPRKATWINGFKRSVSGDLLREKDAFSIGRQLASKIG